MLVRFSTLDSASHPLYPTPHPPPVETPTHHGGILVSLNGLLVSLSKSAWIPECRSACVMVIICQKWEERTNRSGRGDRSAAFFWMKLLHIHTPDCPSLLAFDWSSPAVDDVRRALLWKSPRARASILPPIGAPKTPEEERRCKRCQARVRCSFDADSKGGQPGLFCLFDRGFSSILRTPSPRSSSPGSQRRGGTAAKTHQIKSCLKGIDATMRACVRSFGGTSSVWCNGVAAELHNRRLPDGGIPPHWDVTRMKGCWQKRIFAHLQLTLQLVLKCTPERAEFSVKSDLQKNYVKDVC